MPHLIIEISSNLKQSVASSELLDAAHQALLDSGVFDGPDVKSRLLWLDDFRVGRSRDAEGFIHASLELLAGRTAEVRQQLASDVARVLKSCITAKVKIPVQVSCDVRDMDRASYVKHST